MKRFGLEGCESLIPGMKSVMDAIEETGAEKAIIGSTRNTIITIDETDPTSIVTTLTKNNKA
jgi:hypothetical protein